MPTYSTASFSKPPLFPPCPKTTYKINHRIKNTITEGYVINKVCEYFFQHPLNYTSSIDPNCPGSSTGLL